MKENIAFYNFLKNSLETRYLSLHENRIFAIVSDCKIENLNLCETKAEGVHKFKVKKER